VGITGISKEGFDSAAKMDYLNKLAAAMGQTDLLHYQIVSVLDGQSTLTFPPSPSPAGRRALQDASSSSITVVTNFTTFPNQPNQPDALNVFQQHQVMLNDYAQLGPQTSQPNMNYASATYSEYSTSLDSEDSQLAQGVAIDGPADSKAALVIGISAAVGIALVALGLCLCLYLMNSQKSRSAQKLLNEYGGGGNPMNRGLQQGGMPALIQDRSGSGSGKGAVAGVMSKGAGAKNMQLAQMEMGVMGAQI